MRRSLLLAVVGLVLLAGCATPLQSGGGNAAETSNATVSVSATGTASAEPDQAVVRVSVEATAPTAADARGQVATDTDRVRTALAEAGVPDDAVTTAAFVVEPVYEDGGRDPAGYRAIHALAVETTPDRAGEIIDVAVGNGATRVDGVQFTLSDERRADLRATALERAIATARTDAETVAAAANLSVTGVQSVDAGADFGPYPFARAAEAGGGATTLDPGPVTVTVNVDVTYRA